jgi:glutathione S-transferase
MATRIALYEAGAQAGFIQPDLKSKRLPDGSSYLDINPLGQVPALRTDAGDILLENQAILQHVADAFPEAGLAPPPGPERSRLHQWLSFIGTELHKGIFAAILDRKSSPEVKAYVSSKLPARLEVLDRHLTGRDYLIDRFSVADAYLVAVLNWAAMNGDGLAAYPALADYLRRMHEHPSVARAFAEERALYEALRATKAAGSGGPGEARGRELEYR